MSDIDLIDLIYIVPDIFDLFLSGFIFVKLFGWLNSQKYSNSVIVLWSLIISYLFKTFYSTVHRFILIDVDMDEYLKITIYLLTAIVMAFVISKILKLKILQKILYHTNNKSINDDIFEDIIDYDKPTMMQVYLKNSSIYYVGKFIFREEKGLDSWIVLINYCSADRKKNNIVYNPETDGLKSTVTINLHDVESIELIYEDDSEVWKRLSGIKG